MPVIINGQEMLFLTEAAERLNMGRDKFNYRVHKLKLIRPCAHHLRHPLFAASDIDVYAREIGQKSPKKPRK